MLQAVTIGSPIFPRSSLALRILLAAFVAISAVSCAKGPRYGDVVDHIPKLEDGIGRVIFFGQNLGAGCLVCPYGLQWKPNIKLNGVQIQQRHGVRVLFVVDRPPGIYEVEIDDFRAHNDEYIQNRDLGFTLRAGETKYVMMDSKVKFNTVGLAQGLWQMRLILVDPEDASQLITRHYYLGYDAPP